MSTHPQRDNLCRSNPTPLLPAPKKQQPIAQSPDLLSPEQRAMLTRIQRYHLFTDGIQPSERLEDFWIAANCIMPHYPIIQNRRTHTTDGYVDVCLSQIYRYADRVNIWLPDLSSMMLELTQSPHFLGKRVNTKGLVANSAKPLVLWRFEVEVLSITADLPVRFETVGGVQ